MRWAELLDYFHETLSSSKGGISPGIAAMQTLLKLIEDYKCMAAWSFSKACVLIPQGDTVAEMQKSVNFLIAALVKTSKMSSVSSACELFSRYNLVASSLFLFSLASPSCISLYLLSSLFLFFFVSLLLCMLPFSLSSALSLPLSSHTAA